MWLYFRAVESGWRAEEAIRNVLKGKKCDIELQRERLLKPVDTIFFRSLKDTNLQRALWTSANRLCWAIDSPDLPRYFAGFVQIIFEKAVTTFQILRTHGLSGACDSAHFLQEVEKEADPKRAQFGAFSPGGNWKSEAVREGNIGGL